MALWRAVDAAREEVLRTFPSGTRVSLPEGGFVLWVQLPDGFDGVDVADARGIGRRRHSAWRGVLGKPAVSQLHPHRVRLSRRRVACLPFAPSRACCCTMLIAAQ